MNKLIIQIDMDNVLVDFQSGLDATPEDLLVEYKGDEDEIPGIFSKMKPLEGAVNAFRRLSENYDVYICSTAPWKNPTAWSDKILWVQKYLGEEAHKRLTLTHHKNLVIGDYLIDDRTANGADKFQGEHIHFGKDYKTGKPNPFPTWDSVMAKLCPVDA